MRILIVNKFLYPNGGSETYIFEIGKQLQLMGHEVQYFGMEHEGRMVGNRVGSYTDSMDFHTGKLQKLLYPLRIIYSAQARSRIRAVLDDFKPQVVHLNNFNFQLTPSILYEIRAYEKKSGEKVKIVYTAHDSQLVCPNHLMQIYGSGERCQRCLTDGPWQCAKHNCIHGSKVKSILGSAEGAFYKALKAYRMIDLVIAPSSFMKECLEHNASLKGRIEVLHNFVSMEGEQDSEQNSTQADGRYVLYYGRYSEEKGIRTILGAVEKLPEIPFVFAGSGPMLEEVQRIQNIEEKGFTTGSDLTKLIRGAAFTVFPSECYENCPFSVMEPMLLGVPVLGSKIGGVPELIRDRIDGELFTPGNQDELSGRIKELWEHPEITDRYRENLKDVSFDSTQEYCEKLLELYK